jgi:hypothetical protein
MQLKKINQIIKLWLMDAGRLVFVTKILLKGG